MRPSMRMPAGLAVAGGLALAVLGLQAGREAESIGFEGLPRPGAGHDVNRFAARLIEEGRQTFRYDTFGDEAFWGGALGLHEAIAGESFGGVGPGLSPRAALGLGLKVDAEALPPSVLEALRRGRVNLDDPGVTLDLLRANAVLGVTGFFDGPRQLRAVGIQCALCHSTVDDAVAPGVGRRLDGWANRDLNVGAIVALSPHLEPFAELLEVDVPTVRTVLQSWGPGKFDAELILDGKAFQPDGRSAATLLPPAFGLAGVNLHTWTGWGSVTHWNAFVANLEMHGQGTFYDPRLDNAEQFPIAARHRFGHLTTEQDRITAKLPALHFYQLALAAPSPPAESLDPAAVERGDALFSGKARCAGCHTDGLYTEPGWNLHRGEDIGIDNFQADRSPDRRYRTAPLKGLWTHARGGFYHDGRFATLLDVVNHYDTFFALGLTAEEKADLIEYLRSLGDVEYKGPLPAGTLGEPAAGTAIGRTSLAGTAGLRQVGPNPSRGDARIAFSLEAPGPVELRVYDVRGRLVADLAGSRRFEAGPQSLTWDGRADDGAPAAPGIYFVRMRAGEREWNHALVRLP